MKKNKKTVKFVLASFLAALILSIVIAFSSSSQVSDVKAESIPAVEAQPVIHQTQQYVQSTGLSQPAAAESKRVEPKKTKKESDPQPTLVLSRDRDQNNEFVIADFNRPITRNNVNGDFGIWHRYPDDDRQEVHLEFSTDDALGDAEGHALRLVYDVDSPNPAFNGFWMMLRNTDPSEYNVLNIYIKGDKQAGYPDVLRVEMKDFQGLSGFTIHGISGEWQKFSLPLRWFRKSKEFTKLEQMVIVFDYNVSRPKTGAILIDEITLSNEAFAVRQ